MHVPAMPDSPLGHMRAGAIGISPMAIGVAAYGLAFGLLASQAGFNWLETAFMGAAVLGGSSQIVAVDRLAAGAGITAAFIAGMALNLRLLLIAASMRDLFHNRPLWQRVLGAHMSTDENWALTIARRRDDPSVGYWFLVGSGLMLLATWVISTSLGTYFAAGIPDPKAYALDFAFTAAFIAIAHSLWRGQSDLAPWTVALATVLITQSLNLFDTSWAIVLGGMAGAATAAVRPS